jgi:hypothetical protein
MEGAVNAISGRFAGFNDQTVPGIFVVRRGDVLDRPVAAVYVHELLEQQSYI